MLTTPRLSGAVLLTLLCTASTQVMADNQQLKEAQQKLNQQVLERPFSTPDPVAVETYIPGCGRWQHATSLPATLVLARWLHLR
ncbi:MAG: hypothetical protein IPM37_06350 [Hahellaceae bacterium]|nr:hypothetical protein [Hahellaceae bacterium]